MDGTLNTNGQDRGHNLRASLLEVHYEKRLAPFYQKNEMCLRVCG